MSDFGLPCPNCGQKRKSGGKCCKEQISYLYYRINQQSKVIEQLEDGGRRNKGRRREREQVEG